MHIGNMDEHVYQCSSRITVYCYCDAM